MSKDKLSTVAVDTAEDDAVIKRAILILKQRLRTPGEEINPKSVKPFLSLHYGNSEREVFGMLMLDLHNRLIDEPVVLFQGTLTQVPVFPREVVKMVAMSNAAGVVLFHTHPDGDPSPSEADRHTTFAVEDALRSLDVRVLDHMVVAGDKVQSMRDAGMFSRGSPLEEALRRLAGAGHAHRH